MSPSKTASAAVAIITIFLVVILATSESGVERVRTHLVGEVVGSPIGIGILLFSFSFIRLRLLLLLAIV